MPQDKKPAVVKLRAEIVVKPDLTLSTIASRVGEIETLLKELGTGDVKIQMPRGIYSA